MTGRATQVDGGGGRAFRATLSRVPASHRIVVCEGDQTGQELLDEALRVLDPGVLGVGLEIVRFDLSLANRRNTDNGVVREAAAAMRLTGLGLKAATITPERTGDVGSPNRILREGIGGSVIVRTGRRIPGVAPHAPVVHPIVVVRMAVGDAYGADEGRTGAAGSAAEAAWRTERIERSVCRAVAEYSFRTAAELGATVYGGPKWTVSTVYEGMLKEEMDAAAARQPGVPYRPTLIDAAYAGLLTESGAGPLVVPALNRDGDCLSDLVLAMFGSIAGAESVLLALDEDLRAVVAMAEAPHGTAPSLAGKNVANPMAAVLTVGMMLDYLGFAREAADIEECVAAAIHQDKTTSDLGGALGTREVGDCICAHLRGPGISILVSR